MLEDITYTGEKIDDFEMLERLPTELKDFYLQINGLIAFSGGFHFRGCVKEPAWHSLSEFWVGAHKLTDQFKSLEPTDIPFGQDCFGDQYLLRNKQVILLSSETDEIEHLEIEFSEFLEELQEDPYEFLNIDNVESFELAPGELLNVYPPFCVTHEGEYTIKKVPVLERIRFLSALAAEIKNLPNGAQLKIKPAE